MRHHRNCLSAQKTKTAGVLAHAGPIADAIAQTQGTSLRPGRHIHAKSLTVKQLNKYRRDGQGRLQVRFGARWRRLLFGTSEFGFKAIELTGAWDLERWRVIAARDEHIAELERRNADLERRNIDLEQRVTIDELTELLRPAAFDVALKRLFYEARRFGQSLSLVYADADHFREVNSRFGHLAGDAAVRHVASCIRATLRSCDIAGRLGGDEFAVALPSTDRTGAEQFALRLMERIADGEVKTAWGNFRVTCTTGVKEMGEEHGNSDSLLYGADLAMFERKRQRA